MALILLYHRVAGLDLDPQLLSVSPAHFAEHLQVLREHWHPVSLAYIALQLQTGRRGGDRDVAITFDDGYADNALNAGPLLSDANMPATIFVATTTIESEAEFYWDELERIFLAPGVLPDQLALEIGKDRIEASLGMHATYTAAQAEADRGWNVTRKGDPTPRHKAYRALCAAFYRAAHADRVAALHRLRLWAGARPGATSACGDSRVTGVVNPCGRHALFASSPAETSHFHGHGIDSLQLNRSSDDLPRVGSSHARVENPCHVNPPEAEVTPPRPETRPSHRSMTRDEVDLLAGLDGIEIGAHTHHHPRLAAESSESQEWEIRAGLDRLGRWTGRRVRGFSYPFGTHDAYLPETVRLVRDAGFEYACANFPRRVGPGTDRFRLPRMVVRDWPGEQFRRRLEDWMEAPIAY